MNGGLVPPRAGRVVFEGANIAGLSPYLVARRGIAEDRWPVDARGRSR